MLSKKCQSEGLKKVLKRGTGRFFIERRVSKEEQIKPACITFTRNKWNGRTLFFTITLLHDTSCFNFV